MNHMKNKNSTRFYSDKHEKRTASDLGGRVQTSSGSSAFLKGDVFTENCLVECKTSISEKKSFSIKREWLDKIKEQCREMNKRYPILAFDFGDGENFYVLNEQVMRRFVEFLDSEC